MCVLYLIKTYFMQLEIHLFLPINRPLRWKQYDVILYEKERLF
jgi:hypothetical protein